jgi:hypothetical protein
MPELAFSTFIIIECILIGNVFANIFFTTHSDSNYHSIRYEIFCFVLSSNILPPSRCFGIMGGHDLFF